MSAQLKELAERIRSELLELERVVERVQSAWERAERSGDDYYLDAVALNLHGFYSGLERTFERIGASVDGSLPSGENWHQLLLEQMRNEVPSIRPAVVSEGTYDMLDGYRGFRHVVRNVYTYKFEPLKLKRLVMDLPRTFDQARVELKAFAGFLEESAED